MEVRKNKSFNARYMTFEAVASTFIKNKQFDELLSNSHSVLMGPRGCGKTTLLKMLYPTALYSWQGEEAEHIREEINFWAVYIPTDSQWSDQLKNLSVEFKDNPYVYRCVSNALVCLNVMSALCNCFRDLIKLSDDNPDIVFDKETILAKELIDVWGIEKPISPSIYSILQHIYKEVRRVNEWRNANRNNPMHPDMKRGSDYFYREFIDQVSVGCMAFQEIFKNDTFLNSKGFKWALCFDELEIAPDWLRQEIFARYIRSKDNQSLFFKITSTPLMEWRDVFGDTLISSIPSKDDDYNVIKTWVYDAKTGREWEGFCEKLFNEVIRRHFPDDECISHDSLGEYNIMRILEIDEPNEFKGSDKKYAQGSDEWKLFSRLAIKDQNFYNFLVDKGINPNDPVGNQKQKDEALRKVLPIAVYRYCFLKPKEKDELERRSRKDVTLYFGLPLIYDLSEGNPRTAINIINQFVNYIKTSNNLKISEENQSRIIGTFAQNRLLFFKNYPNTVEKIGENEVSMGYLLDIIGKYFGDDLLGSKFKADPVGSFVVDKNTPKNVIRLIYQALSLGAIQYLDPYEEIAKDGLYGKKFKLSYTLYPNFNIYMRFNKYIALSTIIFNSKLLKKRTRSLNIGVGKLDFGDEN